MNRMVRALVVVFSVVSPVMAKRPQQRAVAARSVALDPATQKRWALLAAVAQNARQSPFSAHFKQVYTDIDLGVRPAEFGLLITDGHGRIRFSYQKPEPKLFVTDGNTAAFFEPDAAQVTVFDDFKQSPLAQSLAFLAGDQQLQQLFVAKACQSAAKQGRCIGLVPKEKGPSIKGVDLQLLRHEPVLEKATLFDTLGNTTVYTFTDRQRLAHVDDDTFVFVPPPTVSVLKTSAWGEAPPGR